jgi:hypothetical protein
VEDEFSVVGWKTLKRQININTEKHKHRKTYKQTEDEQKQAQILMSTLFRKCKLLIHGKWLVLAGFQKEHFGII